jgi:hypothetical protein
MKISKALALRAPKSHAKVLQFINKGENDDVWQNGDIAKAADLSDDHVRSKLCKEGGIKPYTRVIKGARWWGKPAALDALEARLCDRRVE